MATAIETTNSKDKQPQSIFDATAEFFESCRLLNPSATRLTYSGFGAAALSAPKPEKRDEAEEKSSKDDAVFHRWTCNTCKTEFESLQDQRSHFKSDIHRLNIKLSVAGKAILKEEDVDELTSESVQDFDVSSISGSENEADSGSLSIGDTQKGLYRKKLYICLQTGESISIWKSLIMEEAESVSHDDDGGPLGEGEVIERLRQLSRETRGSKHLRIVLLVSGGHFAGSVFDGKTVVAHKTFHRYVVRAKAGKKQSTKDGSGGSIHSAGASLRRYNELALKKDIQELLASWKPYFDSSCCVFVHAPSSSRQLLFSGSKHCFSIQSCAIRNVPFTVRRPTFKESQRIYNQLTQISYEGKEICITPPEETIGSGVPQIHEKDSGENIKQEDCNNEASSSNKITEEPNISDESSGEGVTGKPTPLHEAAKSGDCDRVLELLEQGMDPCAKDERGRTAYMLANEKELRNTFRRFMASNLDKWDWHAAKVPSALTKEMEESQAAKQAEKDAKRKARAKELKKLRKAREKKAQAEAAQSQKDSKEKQTKISKEEAMKRAKEEEREKRAEAAERRMAALNNNNNNTMKGETVCSCCQVSLEGKVPFHRYNYKYCSSSCMHIHPDILHDQP
ncbi:PREDICTED: ankyrin repeat and zinc finger domain-containing protein 1 [Tarenaya hassleriana]|uniref:ankyrin repeat and zinc finger domain-containing protein 1 n=1 Tax=Tarenaya hassleriana TaxID=28532 RepID=UPI00053C951D|nr:PREDICTED: ankyrin repeat and zinc finger domain-containing protein 1 [Tarenaya hassleriana]